MLAYQVGKLHLAWEIAADGLKMFYAPVLASYLRAIPILCLADELLKTPHFPRWLFVRATDGV